MRKLFAIFLILSGCTIAPKREPCSSRLEVQWEICDLAGEPMACLDLDDTKELKAHLIRCEAPR